MRAAYQEGGSANTRMWAWGLPTCGHVEEEGEDTASVIPCPEQPARGIKGQGQDTACQFAGTTLHLLARGDIDDMQVLLGIPHLWMRPTNHHPAPSRSLLESDRRGAAINGTRFSLLESDSSRAMVGRLEVTQAHNPPEPTLLII